MQLRNINTTKVTIIPSYTWRFHDINYVKLGYHAHVWYKCDAKLLWYIRTLHKLMPEHDDVIKWKHFPRYCPHVRGIHRSVTRRFNNFFDVRLNKPFKNGGGAGDLRLHDVNVTSPSWISAVYIKPKIKFWHMYVNSDHPYVTKVCNWSRHCLCRWWVAEGILIYSSNSN